MRQGSLRRLTTDAATAFFRCLPRSLRAWLFDWFSTTPGDIGTTLRYSLAKGLAASIGEHVYIGRFCTVIGWERLRVGSYVSLHEYCYVHAEGGVSIGDHVSIAHGVSLVSFEHRFDNPLRPIRDQELQLGSIQIGPDVWLGAGAKILSGVSVGRRTVVAAGAVVTKSHEGKVVLAGIPARVLSQLQ